MLGPCDRLLPSVAAEVRLLAEVHVVHVLAGLSEEPGILAYSTAPLRWFAFS
jgi:hypothetical protein